MSKRIVLKTLIGILGVVTIVIIILQLTAKMEVEEFLSNKIPQHIQLDYEKISANILTGSVLIEELNIAVANRRDTIVHTRVKADYFEIEGLNHWHFLFNKTLDINSLIIRRPIVKYFSDKKSERSENDSLGVVKLLKTIMIDQIEIENGSFYILKDAQDSLLLESHQINFTLNEFKTDPNIIKGKIPFEHEA